MKALKEKILAITTSLILLALAFSTNTKQVEAAPVQYGPLIEVTLNRPRGVYLPVCTFEVEFTPYSKVGGVADKEIMWIIDNMLFGFAQNQEKNVYSDYDKVFEYEDGVRTRFGQELPKWNRAYEFLSYGYSTYLVTQIAGDAEFITYSKAAYLITFDTAHNSSDQSFLLYVKKIKDDEGNPVEEGKKLYSTPYYNTPIIFNNYYDKKDGNENPTPGSQITEEDKKGFSLRKTIIGENPSKTDEFTFKFKLDKPKISKSPDTEFNYYIVKEDANIEKKLQVIILILK